MEIPNDLSGRIVDRGAGQELIVDDDRGARRLSLGGGMLAVAGLTLALPMAGDHWAWVVAAVPLVGIMTAGLASVVGRRPVRILVGPDRLTMDGQVVGFETIQSAELDGGFVIVTHRGGRLRIPAHGEDDDVRQALAQWIGALPAVSVRTG